MRYAVAIACLLTPAALVAQTIQVFSEFRRVDPFGEIAAPDRAGQPREILSPLMARNCHATFRVMVEAPPGKIYFLFVEQNPEKVLDVTVYKEMYRQYEDAWIADSLLEVSLPYMSHVPDRYHNLPQQRAESFLVDVWVPPDAPSVRMKLDFQLSLDSKWTLYPMEIRISDVVAPGAKPTEAKLPPVTAPSDEVALGPLRDYLCGVPERGKSGVFGARQIIRRNVIEHLAIARERERKVGREAVVKGLLRGLDMEPAAFCEAATLTSDAGPEWYLRGRDFLFRGAADP
ncbi:MAG: hypothetical protein KIT09_22040 [Bryobacteraceae bacterium]|nr:hypothetical protein [Bryobacteraceae bacterium]